MNYQEALDFLRVAEAQILDYERRLTETNTKYREALVNEAQAKIKLMETQGENESESAFEKRVRKETTNERKRVLVREVDLKHEVRMYNVFKERINLAKTLLKLEDQGIKLQ